MRVCIEGWEDGQLVKGWMDGPDRAQQQAAERVTIELPSGASVMVQQQPRQLNSSRLGVGACVWDGALVLAAHILQEPEGTYTGARVIELGAGVGLVGLLLARLGAHVTLTDKANLVAALRTNIARNKLSATSIRPADDTNPGKADAAALEWGSPGFMDVVAQLAEVQPVDVVVATDCCYVDHKAHIRGPSPSTEAFMEACAGLCGSNRGKARVLVTFEVRADNIARDSVLEAARAKFSRIRQLERSQLPAGYQVEHVEVYELML